VKKKELAWWQTDCPICRRVRLLVFWLALMLAADALWFHLIF